MKNIKDIKYGSLDWKDYQYMRMLEERRGHNYSYLTDKTYQELLDKNYSKHVFNNGETQTLNEYESKKQVDYYRNKGYYSRIICESSVGRVKYFGVWFKKRK